MKKLLNFLLLIALSSTAWSQSLLSFSGGYSFANIENADGQATGWRVNGLYEYNPNEGKFAHGFAVGYVSIQATDDNVTNTVSSLPIYYVPKFFIGDGNLKGMVKGALGMQFARLKREGLFELTANDAGFYGGGGAGLMLNLGTSLFLSAEYEIAWVSNSYYRDGWLNSVMAGIGFKF